MKEKFPCLRTKGALEEFLNNSEDAIKPCKNYNMANNCVIDTNSIAQDIHLALATGKTTIKVCSN